MTEREQSNYFFIVEVGSERSPYATMHARGDGVETLSALARTSLLLTATGKKSDHMGYGYNDVHASVFEALAGDEYSSPTEFTRCQVFSATLSRTIGAATTSYDQREVERRATLMQRLQDGTRSAQSILEELTTQIEDRRLLWNVARRWFDQDGRRLIPAYASSDQTKQDKSTLALEPVARNTRRLDESSKRALFQTIPSGGKARRVKVAPFKRDKNDLIDDRQPFLHGVGTEHNTYGYIPRGLSEFVPVLTVLDDTHPVYEHARKSPNPGLIFALTALQKH